MAGRMSKDEFKKWLKARTRKFAVDIFRFVDELPKAKSSQVISFQLAKSASSMGANYREATRAESGADFAHKMSTPVWNCLKTPVYGFPLLLSLFCMR